MKRHFLGALCLSLLPMAGFADDAGDPEKGERVFKKCKACHAVGEGAKNKTGPELNGIIGRKMASIEEFKYSKALKEMGEADTAWDKDNLAQFLEKPKAFAKGTKMSFAGLRKEKDRADVIAYLETFSE